MGGLPVIEDLVIAGANVNGELCRAHIRAKQMRMARVENRTGRIGGYITM